MDSANSSCLQSSSGGDNEFDSHTDSLSAFFHSPTATFQSPLSSSSSSSCNHHLLHPLSYIDSNPLLTNIPSQFATLSSSSPTSVISHSVGAGVHPPPVKLLDQSNVTVATTAPPRSSRKRSRASRRAPTMVLTTDTSNFRAMVHEFTGIPSPPMARPGIDLFHSAAAFRSFSDAPLPASSFLLPRPFTQKLQSPSLASISSTVSATTTSNNHGINPPNSHSYLLRASFLGHDNQNKPFLNTQSPSFTFQSLLQPPLHAKHTLPTQSAGHGLNDLGLPPGLSPSEGMLSIYAATSGQESSDRDRLSSGNTLVHNKE